MVLKWEDASCVHVTFDELVQVTKPGSSIFGVERHGDAFLALARS